MDTDITASLVSRSLLIESLKSYTAQEKSVELAGDAEVSMATPGVQGFLSIVLRVKVRYRIEGNENILIKTFVVKRFPQSEMLIEFSRRSGIFTREGTYFDGVVPIMKAISGGRIDVPLPVCYVAIYGGAKDAIVMEDLTEGGYRTPEPRFLSEGMDLNHCRVAMERLGRLHGLAIAAERSLAPEAGGWLRKFPPFSREVCFYEAREGEAPSPLTGMVENAVQTILVLSKELEGLPREAENSGKLKSVLEGLWPTLCRLVHLDPGGCNVPCHGDCWMNNLMFKYDGNGLAVDAKFVDLQVTRYCHPIIDVLYFVYLSTTRSFRESHLDSLLDEYYSSMAETLNVVGGGAPPIDLQQLRRDAYGDYKPFGVVIGAIMVPFFMLGEDLNSERPSSESLDNLLKTGNADLIRGRFSSDVKFRSRLEEIIRELVEMAFPNGLNSLKSSPLLA